MNEHLYVHASQWHSNPQVEVVGGVTTTRSVFKTVIGFATAQSLDEARGIAVRSGEERHPNLGIAGVQVMQVDDDVIRCVFAQIPPKPIVSVARPPMKIWPPTPKWAIRLGRWFGWRPL